MKYCVVIGDPIEHSKSPELHNGWYQKCGIENQYKFSARRVKASELESFFSEVKNSNIRGISVTAPHKQAVIPFLDELEPTAKKIGAVNTIVNEAGKLTGYNTDWIGVVRPLEIRLNLSGINVCVIGTGGAARAAAWGLTTKGAKVSIWGRDKIVVKKLAFEINGATLSDLSEIKDFKIVINATTVGMSPNETKALIDESLIQLEQIIFDLVYTPEETELLKRASKRGATTISGTEMFITQAKEQFRLYTGITL